MNDIVIHGANAVLEDGARRADIGIEGERITEIGATSFPSSTQKHAKRVMPVMRQA